MRYVIHPEHLSASKNSIHLLSEKSKPSVYKQLGLSKEWRDKVLKEKQPYTYTIVDGVVSMYVLCSNNDEKNRGLGAQCQNLLATLRSFNVNITSNAKEDALYAFTEGFLLSTYSFDKYKSKKPTHSFQIGLEKNAITDASLVQLKCMVEATFVARDLINEPHSYLNATQFSKDMHRLGKEHGFEVETLQKKEIEKHKMGGLLAVNKGSIQPPTFNILSYQPKNAINKKPFILVGKGVVYDTGGLSLKPTPNSMDKMKSDMGGGAAVVGAFCALSRMQLPISIIGLIPATDNRPGLDAYAPGDVITMYDGTTVEVLNTDAEGRLILADALHYAKQFNPELVIDMATLTGAAAYTLGDQGVVYMANVPDKMKKELEETGMKIHERLVEFPLWEEYGQQLKSDIADIKNIGGPAAGAITAGKFLEHFTDYPWIHIDIAGSAFIPQTDSYRTKGGTGVGVRLLSNYLIKQAKHAT